MKKQTTIYLSETDHNKLEEIKKKYQIKSNGEIIRVLISNEYFHLRQMKTNT